ncbi:MAG TPA: hypothetical protein VEL31_20100 [Ktedonobacteraceae bacterium]|nr:hypothetical protein [Ktedonobacteraceae bacterium]
MENTNKIQHWNNAIASRTDDVGPALIVGIVAIVMLAALTGLNPLLGMMSALVLFLLVLVVPRPVLIVYGLVLIMPLTDGLVRGAVVPILRLGQALLVLAFILFLLARPGPLGRSRLTAIDLAFGLFFLSEAAFPVLALYYRGEHLDLNNPGTYGSGTPLQTLLGPLQYYLVYRIAVSTITAEKQIASVLKLSFVASIAVSVIGILEKFVAPVDIFIQTYYPSIAWKYAVPLDERRITSTMESFTGLASYLTATLIVALACSTAQKGLKISPLLLATTLLLDSMALLLTGTFASFFGLAVGATVVFMLFRRLPKWILIALVGIALSALIFQSFIAARFADWLGGTGQGLFPTFGSRIVLWKELFLPAISQHLLFGAGPAPAVLNVWPTEETQYLGLLLRGGLPYFFSYFLLMGVAMATCWRRIKNKSNDLVRTVAIAALAILVAINVMNVSSLYFTYPGITQTLFMLLAIIVASEQLEVQGSEV